MSVQIAISQSVGNRGKNHANDVRVVQSSLNQCLALLGPLRPLRADGECGPVTIGVIMDFQRRVMGAARPDGRIDPGGRTLQKLGEVARQAAATARRVLGPLAPATPLVVSVQAFLDSLDSAVRSEMAENAKQTTLGEPDFDQAAEVLGVEPAAIKAIARVESHGSAFLKDGRPKILFEGHLFSKETGGKYDKEHPKLSYPTWTRAHYGKTGAAEYERLDAAVKLDRKAALRSTSWGKFQILGMNHKAAGYATVELFVEDMKKGEAAHLLSFVRFIQAQGWTAHLKNKEWAAFAKKYNGPSYAVNKYDVRLAQAYEAYAAK